MSNKSEGFISNIFNNSVISGSLKDIREQMTYNYTKSYPSINSSNAGLIHSEENVRWLTKQFTKKPFIIQYDDNDMDEFAYTGADLYAGIANGGMVNIDGYIINSANDMTALSFDNTKTVKIGTNSNGYIGHYQLQFASQQFLKGLENSDLSTYIDMGNLDPNSTSNSVTIGLSKYFTEHLKSVYPDADLTTENCWEYTKKSLSNIYKQELRDNNIEYNYTKSSTTIPLDFDISKNASIGNSSYSSTSIYVGNTTITYEDDIKDYIVEHMDYENLQQNYPDYIQDVNISRDATTNVVNSITVSYKIYYGILKDKLKSRLSYYGSGSSQDYIPSIYIEDIFGFCYLFVDSMHIQTLSYPSTQDTNINLLQDTITPSTQPDSSGRDIIRGLSTIYDASKLYREVTLEDGDGAYWLNRAIENVPEGSEYNHFTLSDLVTRDDTQTDFNEGFDLNTLLNTHFTDVTAQSIINTYETYNNTTVDVDVFNSGGHLNTLCDNYYCLPLNSTLCRLFCLPSYNNNYVPVGFMTSSGALMIRNYERRFSPEDAQKEGWSYQTYYIDSYDNSTVCQQIYVEGYISFFRRVCALIYGIDIMNITTSYGNVSETNKYNSEAWNNILKKIQYKEISPDSESWQPADVEAVTQFFGVANFSDLTFDVIYNKLLAPYINFYIQLSSSALQTDTLSSTNNNFKAVKGYSVVKNSVEDPSIIVEDTSDDIKLKLTHIYSNGVQTFNSDKILSYQLNTQTDYQRLNNYLCAQDGINYTEGLIDRSKVNVSGLNTPLDRASLCEDYITYLKGCARIDWADVNRHDNKYIQSSFRITTLETDSNNTYDKFAVTNKVYDMFASYFCGTDNSELAHIQSNYIQNVCLSTATLLPIDSRAYKSYKWYGQPESRLTAPNNPMDYVLKELTLATRTTIDYDGSQMKGVSGFYYLGMSQGWCLAFPTLFRLYKDGQNYLEGRKRGTVYHAGLYIDYKLPKDVQQNEFWFTNTWLSAIRSATEFDIENSGLRDTLGSDYINYPSNTDGMRDYLHLRNHTLFSSDVIYSIDENGNYISMQDYINNLIQFNQNSFPELDYVDFMEDSDSENIVCTQTTHSGLLDNVNRLHEYVQDLSWNIEYSQNNNSVYELTLENNKYYDLTESSTNLDTLIIEGFSEVPTSNINRYGINTTADYSDNTIIRCTVKTRFQNSFVTPFQIILDTTLNEFTNSPISVIWDSNYPVTIVDSDTEPKYTIQVIDPANIQTTQTSSICFIELEIHLNSTKTTGIGHCNISLVASDTTLTMSDMNYLWKEFYTLDKLSWKQVSEATRRGLAKKLWTVGNIKTFNMTYNGTTYPLQAMIIGINEEPGMTNTITWLTNIYNDPNVDAYSCELLNTTFSMNLSRGTNYNKGRYGYDGMHNGDPNNGYDLAVVNWLNNTSTGVLGFCDSEFRSTVVPVVKTTGLVYTYSDGEIPDVDPGSNQLTPDVKLLCASASASYDDTTYSDLYRKSGRSQLYFWLPSLSELNIPFVGEQCDDAGERKLNWSLPPVITRESPYYITQEGDAAFLVNEQKSNSETNPCTYSYFKLPKSQQNAECPTLLTRSYYTINLDINTLSPVPTLEDYTYTPGDYDNCDRFMYLVGTAYTPGSEGRWLGLLRRKDMKNQNVTTDFCFVTG